MRVLFITRKYPPQKGGMESYSYQLISHYDGEKKVLALGKKQIHLVWFLPWCMLYTLCTLRRWDVIQLGDMLLCSVGKLAKLFSRRVKVVAAVHGLDLTFQNPIYQWYLRIFGKGFDCYLPNSAGTAEIARAHGLSPLRVIYPATLDTARFSDIVYNQEAFCKKYNLPPDAAVLCTTGRLVRRKGVAWFVRHVMPLLQAENVVYLVAGAGKEEAEIRAAIAQNDLAQRVRLLGRISDADLDALYLHADIFVMPNISVPGDVEGYGMVAVEAAYAGCVVVAARLQGIVDAVSDGVSGLLVEPENARGLADHIKSLKWFWKIPAHMPRLPKTRARMWQNTVPARRLPYNIKRYSKRFAPPIRFKKAAIQSGFIGRRLTKTWQNLLRANSAFYGSCMFQCHPAPVVTVRRTIKFLDGFACDRRAGAGKGGIF